MIRAAHNALEATSRLQSSLTSAIAKQSGPQLKLSQASFSAAPAFRVTGRALSSRAPIGQPQLLTGLSEWGGDPASLQLAAQRIERLPSLLADHNTAIEQIELTENILVGNNDQHGDQKTSDQLVRSLTLSLQGATPELTLDNAAVKQEGSVVKRVLSYDVKHLDDDQLAQTVRVSFPMPGAVTKGGIRVIPYHELTDIMPKAELAQGAEQLARGMLEKIICVGIDTLNQKNLGFILAGGKSEVNPPMLWMGTSKIDDLFHAMGSVSATILPLDVLDTPAPDMRSGPKEMDAYAQGLKDSGVKVPGFWITGKGGEGAHPLRPSATGEGVAEVFRQMLTMDGSPITMDQATIAIQGAGNVGEYTARSLLENDSAKITALSDMGGAMKLSSGITLDQLDDAIQVVKGKLTIDAFNLKFGTDATLHDSGDIWSLGANVWMPAANKDSISLDDLTTATKDHALMIVCGANNALSEETIAKLNDTDFEHALYVAPPEIANPIGVAGSALEMDTSRLGIDWDSPEGQQRIEQDKAALKSFAQEMCSEIIGTHISGFEKGNGYQARNHYVAGRLSGEIDNQRALGASNERIDLKSLV